MQRTKTRANADKLKWGSVSNKTLYKGDSELARSLENIALIEVNDLAVKAEFGSKNQIALTFTYTNPETGLLHTHRFFSKEHLDSKRISSQERLSPPWELPPIKTQQMPLSTHKDGADTLATAE